MRIVGFVFLALAFVAPVHAAQTTFRIATLAPDGSSWMTEMRTAASEIEKRTEGRVAFKFYPGGVMGNDQSVLRKMRIGQLHGAAFTGGGLAGVYPDIQVLGLPFLFRSLEEVDYLRRELDPVLSKGLEEAGFVNFGFAEGGFAKIMSTTPIRTTDNLKNEKAWVPDNDRVAYRVMSALGVSPVKMPITDVLTGLQTGLVSVVGASPLGAIAFQWHTRVNYMTDEPLIYLVGVFAMDRKAFSRLSESDQAVTREIMEATFRKLNRQNRADNESARDVLHAQGTEFIDVPKVALEGWREAAKRINLEMAEEGLYSKELAARAYELLDKYRAEQAQ